MVSCWDIFTVASAAPNYYCISPFQNQFSKICAEEQTWAPHSHDVEAVCIAELHSPHLILCLLVDGTLSNVAQPLGNST